MQNTAVVVPNWNGIDSLKSCLDSLLDQTEKNMLIVVDNGSVDGSVEFLKDNYPSIELIINKVNLGFAGGVNKGFERAIELGVKYVASFNNDAIADKDWLRNLVKQLDAHDQVGIAACKLLGEDGKYIDSTGDYYTNWGLPYPRGRGESDINKFDDQTELFGASGGASLYRISMLKQIGLFDEDFFAYYEDVDISFRAQLAGWKIVFVPNSVAYHQIGATSSKIKGFTTYQTAKNLPLIFYKNIPTRYLFRVGIRLAFAQYLFNIKAIYRGQIWPVTKGTIKSIYLVTFKVPKKRREIQGNKRVSDEYIWNLIVHDLPPNASALRKIRSMWWRLVRKKHANSN